MRGIKVTGLTASERDLIENQRKAIEDEAASSLAISDMPTDDEIIAGIIESRKYLSDSEEFWEKDLGDSNHNCPGW